jgi:predicted dithiol-disulfide oxidoreductase (DUF899 family)
MTTHQLVSREDWVQARLALLEDEKAHTRRGDELAARRRALPWVVVEDDYVFEGPDGRRTLAELFDGRRQLVMYHFMFGPDWDAGCERCSYFADNFEGIDVHLAARDTTFLAVSNTSVANIEAYKARMGWSFTWVSSLGSPFGVDFDTTFRQEDIESGNAYYNYRRSYFWWTEAQGLSAFVRLDDGRVAHTYSTYARGIDAFNGANAILDLTAQGRDESAIPMEWVRRHDEYPAPA